MQLKKRQIKTALFTASYSLLGANATAAEWDFDSAVMYYSETDRVTATELILQAKRSTDDEREFNGKLVIDGLTGASASGAVPQNSVQTFTRPSGKGQYQIEAGELPLDDTFRDTRVQLGLQWTQPWSKDYTVSSGINLSREFDYQSVGLNGVLSREFNRKNTTFSLGLSYAADTLSAVGGRPVPLSSMVVDEGQFASRDEYFEAFNLTRQSGGEDARNTLDLVLGLTQVINRRWITQFNIGVSNVDGYLTDPYKLVSVVDDNGIALSHRYESRPDTRAKQTFYAQSKYHFAKSIWDISYRFANDDWGVQSHTVDTHWRLPFGDNSYFEPHVRLYQQAEADFYMPFVYHDETLPEFVSADYRIGKLNAYTLGLKYGKQLKRGHEFGVRLEYYNQAPQDVGKAAPGELASLDLYPSLDALVLQFDYSF